MLFKQILMYQRTVHNSIIYFTASEFVGKPWRKFCGAMYMMFWALGFYIFALIAYLVPAWRPQQLAITLPLVFWLTLFYM